MIFTEDTMEQLNALHDMQELGGINMFGADEPLREMFMLGAQESRKVLAFFMNNYQEDRDYSQFLGQKM